MDRMSHHPQMGMSVNASGSLQTSTVASPNQVIPRTTQDITTTQNISFTSAPNLTQIVFHENTRHDGMKFLTNPVQQQPLIIGNMNAASILTAALTNRGNNSVVLPSGMMGLSASVNSNSLVGIVPVPVFIQGTSGGWLQPSSRPDDEKIGPLRTSQQIVGCVNSAAHNINYTLSHSQIPQTCVKTVATSDQQPVLSSSDTVILHRLSSQDTVKLPSESVPKSSELNVFPLQNLPSLNSTFSLLPNIPERTVSLTSIPTVTLFSPEQNQLRNSVSQAVPFASNGSEENVSSDFSSTDHSQGQSKNVSQINCAEDLAQTNSFEENRKNKERLSESEPCQLHIDESVDTDVFDSEGKDSKPIASKENKLTRSDTMILDDESSEAKVNDSEMCHESDTIILPDSVNFEKDKTKSSEGFQTESMNLEQPSSSSAEIHGNIPSSGSSNPSPMPQHQQPVIEKVDSFQSVPNLVLTDSIVNGTYNPNILCSLISQNSNIQQPSFFTSVNLNPVESETLTELTPVRHQPNTGIPHVQLSLPTTSQDGAGFSDAFDSNSSSAKGTQTDWIFGNSSIYFKPVKMSDIENSIAIENKTLAESSTECGGNTQSTVDVAENAEDVINGPLILDEQAVPASVLNLIPPHVNLFNSTAEMNQTNITSATGVGETSDTSNPLFPCPSCDQAFLTKQTLHRHVKEHREVLKCDLCTATFTRMGNYVRHRKIHNLQPESQKIFTCEHCNREFLQNCDLRRHLLIHSKQEPHRCEICGKGYIRRSDLVVHMRFHNKEKAFKCSICDKSFFQSGDLGRHIRRTHKPNSELTCGHCDRKYACETTLIRHMKVMHKDIILKTVKKRLQEKKDDQSDVNNQDLLFAMNEGNDSQEQNASKS